MLLVAYHRLFDYPPWHSFVHAPLSRSKLELPNIPACRIDRFRPKVGFER